MTTKTYSSKYNAVRAAKTAGLDPDTLAFVQKGDGWVWKAKRVDAAKPAQAFEAPAEEIAAQATRPSVIEMATAIEARETPEGIALAQQIKDWREKGQTRDFRPAGGTAPKKQPKATSAVIRPDGLREGSAMAKLVDAVMEPGGKTNAELCELVGWGQCLPMLRKSCQKAGLTLETVKEKGQPARYVASRPKSKAA